jgi:hypothetical protein
MHTSASGSNLRPESTYTNVSQFLAAKFVELNWFRKYLFFFV